MRHDPELIPVLNAADALRGSQRRLFMAKTVKAMGRGGQRWALVHLGWCRDTIRKGMQELNSGMTCVNAFSARRRKPAEELLPRLLDDIRDIVDGRCQADPGPGGKPLCALGPARPGSQGLPLIGAQRQFGQRSCYVEASLAETLPGGLRQRNVIQRISNSGQAVF